MTIWFPGGIAILLALAVLVVLKRRGKPLNLALLFYAGTPTGPGAGPGLAYLFPGRGSPTDPGPDLTPTETLNPHLPADLPRGVAAKAAGIQPNAGETKDPNSLSD